MDPNIKLYLFRPIRTYAYQQNGYRAVLRRKFRSQSLKVHAYWLEAYGRAFGLGYVAGTLAALALTTPGKSWRRNDLISLVWPDPDDEPENPSGTINSVLHHLRRSFFRRGLVLDMFARPGCDGVTFYGIRLAGTQPAVHPRVFGYKGQCPPIVVTRPEETGYDGAWMSTGRRVTGSRVLCRTTGLLEGLS